jgi:hypothetical protein
VRNRRRDSKSRKQFLSNRLAKDSVRAKQESFRNVQCTDRLCELSFAEVVYEGQKIFVGKSKQSLDRIAC